MHVQVRARVVLRWARASARPRPAEPPRRLPHHPSYRGARTRALRAVFVARWFGRPIPYSNSSIIAWRSFATASTAVVLCSSCEVDAILRSQFADRGRASTNHRIDTRRIPQISLPPLGSHLGITTKQPRPAPSIHCESPIPYQYQPDRQLGAARKSWAYSEP